MKHKSTTHRLAVLLVFATWTELPSAQTTDDDWAESQQMLEEFSVSVDTLSLTVGSSQPWPRPDPELPSAEAWREAVLAAPRVTAAEILAGAGALDVQLFWTPKAKELLGEGGVWRVIAQTVHDNGQQATAGEVVALKIILNLQRGEIEYSKGGTSDGSEPVSYLAVEVGLVVPARVLRGDSVHYTTCVVDSLTTLKVSAGEPTRDDVIRGLDQAMSELFGRVEGEQSAAAQADDSWAAWLANPEQSEARFATFRDSFRTSAELDAGLHAIAGFRDVRGAYHGRENVPAATFLQPEGIRGSWLEHLRASGFAIGYADGPWIENEILLAKSSATKRADYLAACCSRVALSERDCLAVIDGRFVRVSGDTWSTQLINGGVPRQFRARTQRLLKGSIASFVRELGQGGLRGGAPHPNAELVASFLRTRQFTEVPEPALLEIAHRIAVMFAPASQEWIATIEGERMLYLPWIGAERERSKDIERRIDQLTLADPLGLFLFDNIWNHDRSPPDFRPVLPEGFARRFEGPRPSGPGALCGVWVLEPAEAVRQKLMHIYDFQERGRINGQVYELMPALAGHKLLRCQYIPNDGNMNLVHDRWFWLGSQPDGWEELRNRFPTELNFASIGPPIQAGLDYLSEADQRIEEGR